MLDKIVRRTELPESIRNLGQNQVALYLALLCNVETNPKFRKSGRRKQQRIALREYRLLAPEFFSRDPKKPETPPYEQN